MGWVFRWQHVGMQRWTSRSLSALEERTDQGIFYLHIMALHAERESFGLGVVTSCFPISFVVAPAAVVLSDGQIHQDQSRHLVKQDLVILAENLGLACVVLFLISSWVHSMSIVN